jgi:glycosyltransferase involved in cell wall biosynthesis
LVELGNDAAKRERMGRAARERIAAHFSLERMAADYRRVLLAG